MFGLTKLTLRRPVSVFMIIVALLVFGISTITTTPMELIPDIEMPMLVVMTPYTGAPPEDVDSLVGQPLEDAISSVAGIKNVQSSSMEHYSLLMIEFEYGTNIEEAHDNVKNAIDVYKNSLPEAVGDPTIIEISMSMMSTMTLNAAATADIDLASYVNDNIVPELDRVPGIASISISGGQKDYISIELDEEKVNQYGLSMQTIATLVSAADFTLPVGTLGQGDIDMTVRGGVNYPTAESLKDIPITLATGDVIHLSDVARVYMAKEDASSISRFNGGENVSLNISKRQSASTLAVTRAVKAAVEDINAQNLGVQLDVIYDASTMILMALNSLSDALFYGVILAMIVLFVFFGDWRASVIVGTSIPISLLVTVCAMGVMDFSFNMMSIGGLVIGVGMMVDNSIVVIESCFRMRELGLSTKEAVLEGTKTVIESIIAGTITTVVVFLPIAVLEGMSGELFGELCFTIVFSLTASLISAVTIAPLMFYRTAPVAHEFATVGKAMNKLYGWYANFLPKTFKHKKTVVVVALALLVASTSLVPFVGVELLPETDEGTINININTRPGLSVEALDKKLISLEEMVASHPDVDRYSLTAGGSGLSAIMGGTSSTASITAYLKSPRDMSTSEVVDQWRRETSDIIDCDISVSSFSTTSMMTGGSDVNIAVEADDLDSLKIAANQVTEILRQNEWIIDANSGISSGTPQAEVVVDPIKAGANGFVPASVMSTIYTMLSGTEAMTITEDGREYSVKVEFPDDRYETIADLEGMTLVGPTGMQVALSDIATIEYSDSPESITRLNGRYQITVTGQQANGAPNDLSAQMNEQAKQLSFPSGVEIVENSVDATVREEFTGILRAIGAAVFLVFTVMAMQFESPRFSLVVMFCMPFALVGSFTIMFVTQTTFNLPSLMGFLMLVGTVVNNGILFIDTANQMRYEDGIPAEDALLQSGLLRMRPIFMTTLTTVLAMVPMAITQGANAELMRGMALVIIGGLIASTILTLLLLPTFYMLFDSKLSPEEKERIREEKVMARVKREQERMAAKAAK
ncbi:MAG: efflux RND transporter permease subunit [Oscillospiraceae bacterium]|nr:efflux RND transporter permease subunit [Oscillospiraceae bacterium]